MGTPVELSIVKVEFTSPVIRFAQSSPKMSSQDMPDAPPSSA